MAEKLDVVKEPTTFISTESDLNIAGALFIASMQFNQREQRLSWICEFREYSGPPSQCSFRHQEQAPTLGEDPQVIRKILAHLDDNASPVVTALLPECRAPPLVELLRGL